MPRRRSQKKAPKAPLPGPLAHRPFSVLKGLKTKEKEPPPPARPLEKKQPLEDETKLFQSAMADVAPLERKKGKTISGPGHLRPETRPFYSEDLEALAHLEDLVAGRAVFDLVDSDEYLEGYIRGIHPGILTKLRQGRFSVQAYLDLHGLTAREAEEAVREFIPEAVALGYRCVLLVHGRGLNSKDQIPVLKKRLEAILLRGPVRKKILAFTSARPHDGGTGASYVLLRA